MLKRDVFPFFLLYLGIFIRWEAVMESSWALVSRMAMGLVQAITALAILTAFAYHTKFIEMVRGRRVHPLRFSMAGLLVAGMLTFYNLFQANDPLLIALVTLLIVLLFLRGRMLFAALEELLPLRDLDIQMFLPIYPPRARADLVRIDCGLILLLLLPFLAKSFH